MTTSYPIGRLILHPHRELLDGGAPLVIGGRALDLLSVLAAAEGAVLSKDHLLREVWGNTIVEDNALQAQVSAARKALGDEAGRLVTVHGRGYRLVLDGELAEHGSTRAPGSAAVDPAAAVAAPAASAAPADIASSAAATTRSPPRWWTRRAAAGAVAAAAAGTVLGVALWPGSKPHVPDPRAVELYRRGKLIEGQGEPETLGEARKLYERAVAIDPKFAEGWAALALIERMLPLTWVFGDPDLVRAPAQRALALDPNNDDAQLALILVYPQFRRWLAREVRLRAFLGRHPQSTPGHISLCRLLLDVGRCEDALVHARAATNIDPAPPTNWHLLGHALHLAGRQPAAHVALEDGLRRSPQNRYLWAARYWTLLENKEYAEASTFARARSRRPRVVPEQLAQTLANLADELGVGGSGLAWRTDIGRQPARSKMEFILVMMPLATQLGMTDEVFETLEVYYFGGVLKGTRIAPPGPLDLRTTQVLFNPVMLGLRDDPRFGRLLERTGLEDYWRKSGTQPDFRRG